MTNKSFSIVFPGQGSQSVGMLGDIAAQFGEVKETFTEASDLLGYDMWKLVCQGPAEELDKTTHTQPALLTGSYAIWRILQSRKPLKPAMLAGHSLGEYTALVCAGALAFSDAVRIVAARGQYMQEAVPPGIGAMAAIIGLDETQVAAICKQSVTSEDEILSPANFNSIGQIVVAGHQAAVIRAVALAKAQGAKLATLIPVSVPSHCELMRPAAVRLVELLAGMTLQQPMIPVLSNVDVMPYRGADSIRDGLVRQLYSPVRWVETIQQMIQAGVSHITECGPGKVLTGLNKRIDKSLQLMATSDLAGLEAVLTLETE